MSAEKVLVYWLGEKRWSVVSPSATRGEAMPGDQTLTKYQGKWYPTIIIAKDHLTALGPVEDAFKNFLNSCLLEEAEEDVEKCIFEYIKAAQSKVVKTQEVMSVNHEQSKESQCPADKAPIVKTPAEKVPAGHAMIDKAQSKVLKPQEKVLSVNNEQSKDSQPPADKVPAGCAVTDKGKEDNSKTDARDLGLDYLKRKHESPCDRRFKKLEEEVKSLRRKIRKLEEKSDIKPDIVINPAVEKSDAKPEIGEDGIKLKSSEDLTESVEVLDEKTMKQLKGDQERFKFLCRKIFTDEELRNCSRTGKRTVKSGETPRPPLDACKFEKLKKEVQRICSFDKDLFLKKFENLQKVLRKSKN